MKTQPIKSVLASLVLAALTAGAMAAEEKCKPVYDSTYDATKAKPEEVLAIVDKEATASPDCVCPVISAAIAATDADKDLKIQIVKTALNAVPEQAPAIKACLPEAASVIESMIGATGDAKSPVADGKEPVSTGKAPVDKMPVVTPPVVEDEFSIDWGLYGPGIVGGVYLSSPSYGGGGLDEEPPVEVIVEVIKKVRVPGPRVTIPATEFKF